MTPVRVVTSSSNSALLACAVAAALTSIAFAPSVVAGIKYISIEKQQTAFDASPAIVMKDSGNGYVLDRTESAKIRMRIQAKADKKNGLNNVITIAKVGFQNRTFYQLPLNYRPVEIDDTVETLIGPNDLQMYVADAASKCNLGSAVDKVVKLPFYIGVRFDVWDLGPSEHRSASETFQGIVACGPRKAPKGPGGVVADLGDFKVKAISARLLTTAGKPSSPNPGTKCQVTTARVRIETSKAGAVKFKLWTKIGSETKSEVIDAWSSFVGPGKHEAVFEKKITVERSSPVQIKAEEMVNPIGLSTPWKMAQLHCDGAGGGGLASPGNNAGPQGKSQSRKPTKTTGELTTAPRPTQRPTSKPNKVEVKTAPLARPELRPQRGMQDTGRSSTRVNDGRTTNRFGSPTAPTRPVLLRAGRSST